MTSVRVHRSDQGRRAVQLATTALAGAILGLAAAPPASAAPTQDQPASAQLEEIVVTAQRREENLQDVPIAVSAASGTQLADFGIDQSSDLTLIAPAISFQSNVTGGGLTIRGIGGSLILGDEPANAVYVDGVYQSQAALLFTFNNVERVEVLKGPQGTLFGRNATGGLVQIVTKAPSHDPHLDVSAGYASFETVTGQAYVTGGLGDHLAADLSVYLQRQDKGWGRDLSDGRDAYRGHVAAARGKLRWEGDGGDDVTLALDYSDYRPPDLNGGSIYRGYRNLQNAGSPGFYNTNQNLDSRYDVRKYGASLTAHHDLGWARVANILALSRDRVDIHIDQDISTAAITEGNGKETQAAWSDELQLMSDAQAKLNWIVGLFYYHNEQRLDPLRISGAALGPRRFVEYRSTNPVDSYAVYAQGTGHLSERARLTLGVRYTVDDRSTHEQLTSVLSPTPFADISDSHKDRKVTTRLALDYDVADDVLAYASYTTGFKSGVYSLNQVSPAGVLNPVVRPQTIEAYEIGLKSELFDRRVRLNLAAFYYNFEDIQLRQVVPGGGVLLNAGEAEQKGVDVDFEARPTQALTLRGGVSYLDSEYTRFPNAPFFRQLATGGLQQFAGDATGHRTVNSPQWVATLGAQYTAQFGDGELVLAGDYEYNDGYFYDPQSIFKNPAHQVVNASITWKAASDAWDVRLWANNLLDEQYLTSVNYSAPLGAIAYPAAPRTVGVTLGLHY